MTTNTCGTRLTCSWADAQRVVCGYLLLGTLMSPTAPLWGGADGTCEIVSLDGVSDAALYAEIEELHRKVDAPCGRLQPCVDWQH